MKMLGLEMTCGRIRMLQVGSPFLSGGWLNLPKQKASANTHGCCPGVKTKGSPILRSLLDFSSYWMQFPLEKLQVW